MAITKVSPGLLDLDSGITITTSDNTAQLTLLSTDADAAVGPILDLYRNSSSPADDDFLGKINFKGRNDNSQDVDYGYLAYYISDASDGTEDAFMQLAMIKNGSNHLMMEVGASEIVFNQGSVDIDFRVESNDNANALFVEGATGNVGIGVVPAVHYGGYEVLDIGDTLSLISNNTSTNVSTLTNNGYLNSDASAWVRKVTDEASMYSQVNGDHRFSTAGAASAGVAISWSEKIRFQAAGGISFNGDTAAANALDDYEEGSWTPTSGVTLTVNTSCRYRKIGSILIVTFDVTFASATDGNTAVITNLPFSYTTYNSGFSGWQNTSVGVMYHVAGTTAYLYNAVSNSALTYTNTSGKRVIGTIVGIVA